MYSWNSEDLYEPLQAAIQLEILMHTPVKQCTQPVVAHGVGLTFYSPSTTSQAFDMGQPHHFSSV